MMEKSESWYFRSTHWWRDLIWIWIEGEGGRGEDDTTMEETTDKSEWMCEKVLSLFPPPLPSFSELSLAVSHFIWKDSPLRNWIALKTREGIMEERGGNGIRWIRKRVLLRFLLLCSYPVTFPLVLSPFPSLSHHCLSVCTLFTPVLSPLLTSQTYSFSVKEGEEGLSSDKTIIRKL